MRTLLKKISKTIMMIILLLLLIIIIYVVYSMVYLNQRVYVANYKIETDFADDFRIIQLTDLHDKQFGIDNEDLIQRVKENNPDIIVMTGDMINQDNQDPSDLCQFIEKISYIAPVYYSYGNHEYGWERNWGEDLTSLIEKSGATVLKHEYIDTNIKGNTVRIGGYYGYYRRPHMVSEDKEYYKAEEDFCNSFEDTDKYKILLCHIPTTWLDWNCIDDYPIDLIFCGHYHGGIIRIPFIEQGVYAPYVGWFPPYTKGIFKGEEATCILSTGLGEEHKLPRINNPPEIVFLELLANN